MKAEKIKLGIAPIGWTNDDMPDLGGEITFEQCVSEMALAGYKGCEIGNKYPKTVEGMHEYLDIRGLEIANRWFSSFILTKPFEEVEKDFRENCEFLKGCGAKRIGASEQSYSIQGQMETPVFEKKYVMNDEEWKKFTDGLSKLGNIAKEYGITLVYHHHMGTVVQTAEEIDKMMDMCDPDAVYLLFDTGHLAYCGEDYMAVLKKYAKRIKHVHLKDIRPEIVAKVKAESLSFLQGVRLGAFTVPGDGTIDFKPVFDVLDEADYEGWMLVEAEQDPAIANPFKYAKMAREYIAEKAGI
ncbi:MAG: myo-inosose-2 dehydratase [Clostridia bacterium]|nr:myo-inosose-2 dehydratase [Clostridia bacterium]MEE1064884.1 myo-inosose-2 dehydratase [Acutalibacteraceae bacterium]